MRKKNEDWLPRPDYQDDYSSSLHQRTEELYDVPDSAPDSKGYLELPVLVMRDMVVFPRMISPLFVTQGKNLLAIQSAQYNYQTMVGLLVSDPDLEDPGPKDFLPMGVELAVGRLLSISSGNSSALIQGRRRLELIEIKKTEPFMVAKVRVVNERARSSKQLEALMRTARDLFERCVQLDRSLPEEAHLFSLNIEEPGWLADMISTAISLPLSDRVELLMTLDPVERLRKVNAILASELDVLQLEDDIHSKVQSEVDRSQREYYLREQLKAIQNELGEGDVWLREVGDLKEKIEKLGLPEEVKTTVLKETDRLSQMPSMAPEVGMIRNYIDWILELPWTEASVDNLDIKHASKVLDANHHGLDKAKQRILEFLAVKSLKPENTRQPILCFVGPPGTGKTSLGKSIAEALGRKFARVSLGGVRDEAEIRGHRRTYIGALPGRILQTMKRAGTVNPLFMLDEIDKLGIDFRGDPSAALLEVLDPEQNYSFSDHYLELPYDLSKVMFITTANTTSSIPPALLDRIEIIDFPGYIEDEKVEIANKFLIPRQLKENGLEAGEVSFTDQALRKLIRQYTYEAGVRNLEREISRTLRKIARLKSEGKRFTHQVTDQMIEKMLGPVEFFLPEAELEDEIGVATAMAWTDNGGEIMPIEVLIMEGKGNLQITGQVGDIMQESAQAGLSYIKSIARQFNIPVAKFEHMDIHIHIPEGSIQKDGPSAGVTITLALLSAITGSKVKRLISMTGEITLRGRIIPVGGIREKIMAAHRAGINTILIPAKNEKDLVEVPKKVRDSITIMPVTRMSEIIDFALLPPPAKGKKPIDHIKVQDTKEAD